MRIIAAYLLAVLGGNESPDAATIKKILSSVGVDAEDSRIEQLVSELKGKKIEEVISEGRNKLASVGSVAAPAAGGSSSAPAAAAGKADDKKDDKKKPVVVEEEEEEAAGGGGMGGLFGDEEEF